MCSACPIIKWFVYFFSRFYIQIRFWNSMHLYIHTYSVRIKIYVYKYTVGWQWVVFFFIEVKRPRSRLNEIQLIQPDNVEKIQTSYKYNKRIKRTRRIKQKEKRKAVIYNQNNNNNNLSISALLLLLFERVSKKRFC